MIDEATLREFYSDVPAAYLEKLRSFPKSHTMKTTVVEGLPQLVHRDKFESRIKDFLAEMR